MVNRVAEVARHPVPHEMRRHEEGRDAVAKLRELERFDPVDVVVLSYRLKEFFPDLSPKLVRHFPSTYRSLPRRLVAMLVSRSSRHHCAIRSSKGEPVRTSPQSGPSGSLPRAHATRKTSRAGPQAAPSRHLPRKPRSLGHGRTAPRSDRPMHRSTCQLCLCVPRRHVSDLDDRFFRTHTLPSGRR